MGPREISLSANNLFEEMKNCAESHGLIVYPTDTFYGLGANALDDGAVLRVFAAKKREMEKPLSIVVSRRTLAIFAQLDNEVHHFIDKFVPGPLTVVLYQSGQLSKNLNVSEPEKVAFRVLPSQFRISEFVDVFQIPLTATSANLSGTSDETLHSAVRNLQLEDHDLVIQAEIRMSFIPSTVVDLTFTPPKILREGILSQKLRAQGCV